MKRVLESRLDKVDSSSANFTSQETSLFDEFGEKLLCAMLAFALGYEEGARI